MIKKRDTNTDKGITLIALVITIIVLLILAGVTIASLSGENGILERASRARNETNRAELVEKVKLDVMSNKIDIELGEQDKLKEILERYFINVPDDLSDMDTEVTAKDEFGGYNVALKEILIKEDKTIIKVGDTTLKKSIVNGNEALKNMYGQNTDYKSVEGITWQLFYDDESYIYLIASNYVENSKLPCNGNTINGVTYGETDLVLTVGDNYKAMFSSTTSHNDGALTEGTKYKNGSSSTAISANPIAQTYLKWAFHSSYNTSKSPNICAVAYMMDIEKWSSFIGNIKGAFAMGGQQLNCYHYHGMRFLDIER